MKDKIKEIRKLNKMNQKEFSIELGISQATISNIEKGTYIPSLETIIKLCNTFNIDCNWLLLDKEVINFNEDDYSFLKKYNLLSDREKGRIDQLIDDVLDTKILKKES